MRIVAITDKIDEAGKNTMIIRLGILELIDDPADPYYGSGFLVTPEIFQREHVKACEELTRRFKMKGMNCQSIEKITSSEYNEEGVFVGQRVRLIGMHGCSRSGRRFIDNLHKAVKKMGDSNSLYIYINGTATATPFDGEWEELPAYVKDFFRV